MTTQPVSKPAREKYPRLDDSLEHQIRFMQSPFRGGLGVTVSCVCTRHTRTSYRKLKPLVQRSVESLEDSWRIYETHLDELS